MLRAAASKAVHRLGPSARRSGPPLSTSLQQEFFHASARREEETKAVGKPIEEQKLDDFIPGGWSPIYGYALGITLAVPILNYQWYLVNEETQIMGAFVAFCGVVYHNFGSVIQKELEEEGKDTLAEANAVEEAVVVELQAALDDIRTQQGLVSELEALQQVKADTYDKLNATGKIKPLYTYKAQMEKLLAVIAAEEAAAQEKAKAALMEEATAAVRAQFASSKELQKSSLANALNILKGAKTSDPVKGAYLKFFADKKAAAAKVDESAEIAAQRAALVTKLNTVAMTESFYFDLDPATGKPKMLAAA